MKRDFHYSRSYAGFEDLNGQARQWCDDIANRNIHGSTAEVLFERLAEERRYLQPLVIREPLFAIEDRKATKTQLISIDGNSYSVPVPFACKRVKYRGFQARIELLYGEKVIDTIELGAGRGKSMLQDRHYSAHSRPKRTSHPLQAKFEALPLSAKVYLEGLSQSRTGHLREQMEQIVDLANMYSESELEAAMERGIIFRAFGYGQLKRTLEKRRKNPLSLPGKHRG